MIVQLLRLVFDKDVVSNVTDLVTKEYLISCLNELILPHQDPCLVDKASSGKLRVFYLKEYLPAVL